VSAKGRAHLREQLLRGERETGVGLDGPQPRLELLERELAVAVLGFGPHCRAAPLTHFTPDL
jgi:hypothetical protein